MPIWLRKLTWNMLKKYYDDQQEDPHEKAQEISQAMKGNDSKIVAGPGVTPKSVGKHAKNVDYTVKVPNKN